MSAGLGRVIDAGWCAAGGMVAAAMFLGVVGGGFALGGSFRMAGAGAVGPLLFLCALAFGYGVLRLFLRRVPVRAIGRSRVFRQPETVAVFLAMAVGSLMAVDAFGLALAAMVLVFAAGFLGLIGGCELALLAWSRGAGFGQAVKEVRLRYRPAGEARWNTAVRVGDGGAWG